MAPKKKRTREARPRRAKRPPVTVKIEVTEKALRLLMIVLWLTLAGGSPFIVSAFIR